MHQNAAEERTKVVLKHSDVEYAMEKSQIYFYLSLREKKDINHKLETLTSGNNDIQELEQSIFYVHEMFLDI